MQLLVAQKLVFFENLKTVKKYTKGVKGAIFKGFNDLTKAQNYMLSKQVEQKKIKQNKVTNINELLRDKINKELKENYVILFTDASYNKSSNQAGIANYIIFPNNKTITIQDNFIDFSNTGNVFGEIVGVVNGINYILREKGFNKISIYYDFNGIKDWFNASENDHKNSAIFRFYNNYAKMIKSKGVKINWTHTKAHSNIELNNYVDNLANKASNRKVSMLNKKNKSTLLVLFKYL